MSKHKPIYEAPASGEAGMTELHYAAYSGDLDAVLAAIKEGIDVERPRLGRLGQRCIGW